MRKTQDYKQDYKLVPYSRRVVSKAASAKIKEILGKEESESEDIESSKLNSGIVSIEAAIKSPLRNDRELLVTVGSKWEKYVNKRIYEENNQVSTKEH